jgi:hypothetical protein
LDFFLFRNAHTVKERTTKRKIDMSKDLPSAVLKDNEDLDALMDLLEKGEVPAPEANAPQEVPEIKPVVEAGIETPPVVDDPVTPTPKTDEDRADHRYKTLEGMMRANDRRSAEIISGLRDQLETQRVARVETPLDVDAILNETELAEFGEGGIAVLQKLAGAIATKEIEKASLAVDQKLDAMRRRVDLAEASAEGTGTWDHVEAINPGAKAINGSDAGWFAFLTTVDPVSGREYRELGEAAAGVNDYQRLSMLIDTYRESANLAKPVPSVKPPQTRTALKTDGNDTPPVNAIVYTQDEVRDFYMARALGKPFTLRGKLQKADTLDALEADIETAMEEGRIKI